MTALFADLVGSTALGERLDPEELKLVVGDAVGRIVGAVEAFGGTVKDLAGDGVLALFGAPVAHEDDPERALLAGLRIVEEIGEFADEVRGSWGIDGFGVRVGVESGPVVVGAIGAGSRIEYGATGDAVNLAARLQSVAEPGTVLVGEGTSARVEPLFDWGPAATLELKGKSSPVAARPVIAPLSTPATTRGIEGVQVPVVGRARELAQVRELASAALDGTGAIVFMTGEPGIGKTRLLSEFRDVFDEGDVAARPSPLARGQVRLLRRVDDVLAVPRPHPLVAGCPRRRAGDAGARRAPSQRRAALRRSRPRAHSVPRGGARARARAGCAGSPGRALAGGAPVPDVRGRAALVAAARGGRAGRRRAGGSPLGGRHLVAAPRTAAPRHGDVRAPAGAHAPTGARPPRVATQGGRRAGAPAPDDRDGAGGAVGRRGSRPAPLARRRGHVARGHGGTDPRARRRQPVLPRGAGSLAGRFGLTRPGRGRLALRSRRRGRDPADRREGDPRADRPARSAAPHRADGGLRPRAGVRASAPGSGERRRRRRPSVALDA